MNAMPLLPRDEPRLSPNSPTIYHATAPRPKVRVAIFGSFHGGFHILRQLLSEPLATRVTVTGVATDDLRQPFTHANVRLWRHPHTKAEEEWVAQMAREHDVPVYRGRVKAPEFERMFVEDWGPDLMNLVGVQSNGTSETNSAGRWFEAIDPGELKPANLYDAQLARRLGTQPSPAAGR